MHHFFVNADQITEKEIIINGSDVNHMKNVLRMRIGEKVGVSDGKSCTYVCAVREYAAETVILEILEKAEQQTELPSRIYLFQGLAKGDKMDLVIQKAVELGVYEVIPVETKHCVVRLDEKKKAARHKRWQMIAESAAKQAKRGIIPRVTEVMTHSEAFAYAGQFDRNLIPYEQERGMAAAKKILAEIEPNMSVGIFIGPEGGFAPEEITEACSRGICPISLGRRILRTETAGLCILSVLMFRLEINNLDYLS